MKNNFKNILILAIITASTPSYAQLGDFFRKLGDAVDSVVKKIESNNDDSTIENSSDENKSNEKNETTTIDSSTDKKEQASNAVINPNLLTVDEFKKYYVGRWDLPDACEITTQKSGSYIFLDNKDLLNVEFYRDGDLRTAAKYTSLEKVTVNGRNLIRATGRVFEYQSEFYKQNRRSRPIESFWDVGTQDKVRVIERTIWLSSDIPPDGEGPKDVWIKDGKNQNGMRIPTNIRCKANLSSNSNKSITNENIKNRKIESKDIY